MMNRRPQRSTNAPEGMEFRGRRRKRCPFTVSGIKEIDYKDNLRIKEPLSIMEEEN